MAQKQTTVERWGLRAAEFYARCEGETITVALLTGREFTGELAGVDTYDLALRPDGWSALLLVPKHAVAYIVLEEHR